MYSLIVLSVILLVSTMGLISLLGYKAYKVGDMAYGNEYLNQSDVIKDRLIHILEHVFKNSTRTAFSKGKYVCGVASKHVYKKYSLFSDTMNGKGDISKKGAASFFLKSVSEHKKEVVKNGRKEVN